MLDSNTWARGDNEVKEIGSATSTIAEGLETGRAFHRDYAEHFIAPRGVTRTQIDDTFARLNYTTDLRTAVANAGSGDR